MRNQKIYEPTDKMILLIRDNSKILQSLGSFGISLGFGDKTVQEVCESEKVDTETFLTVVNFTINGYSDIGDVSHISVTTMLHYLHASHKFYLEFELPYIRQMLEDALDEDNNLAKLIMKLYDEYAHVISNHMRYEEKTVFPYVEKLLKGTIDGKYDIDTFSKHHGQTDRQLRELKNIIIKYLPSDNLSNNKLTATLYSIYNCEDWLKQHAEVEDKIFIPAIRMLEKRNNNSDVSLNISHMIGKANEPEQLSEREKEVIVSLVQGMTNKEIADHLYISTNTVITHRRNIAKKLQIHSPAGLTIYAIVNHLVDIQAVKL